MAQNNSVFSRYKIIPLLVVGMVFIVLYTLLGLLIWTAIAYGSQANVSEQTAFPAFLYLSGIFFACALMTALIKGGTVFPAAILSLAAAIVTFIITDSVLLSFGSAFLKALLSLLAGVLGFTLTKLYFIFVKRGPQQLALEDEPAPLVEPASEHVQP